MASGIRILIVDDNPLIRNYLANLLSLQAGLEVIGEAEDGQQGVELAQRLEPEVVVMDCEMPVMDGVKATSLIAAARPRTRVIGYSSHPGDHIALSMMQAGAFEYVSKQAPIPTLIDAIRKAAGRASQAPCAAI